MILPEPAGSSSVSKVSGVYLLPVGSSESVVAKGLEQPHWQELLCASPQEASSAAVQSTGMLHGDIRADNVMLLTNGAPLCAPDSFWFAQDAGAGQKRQEMKEFMQLPDKHVRLAAVSCSDSPYGHIHVPRTWRSS